MRSIFRPIPFALFLLATAAGGQAGESPPASGPAVKHLSTLKFLKGTYTSIFGIVPKRYTVESVETRESVQTMRGPDAFALDLVAANTQRILSLEGETPTIENGTKPLVGNTVLGVRRGDSWEPQIKDVAAPSEAEQKEARRLVARFQPGGSPFLSPAWDTNGKAVLELPRVLRFFGYAQADEIHGSATLQKPEAEGKGASLEMSIQFTSGENVERITVELKGAGEVKLHEEEPGYSKVVLQGELTIHGNRVLEDGRKVPYSLITPYSYETTAETRPAT